MAAEKLTAHKPGGLFWVIREHKTSNGMESNDGRQQQAQEEAEGKAVLVSIETEDVDASGVDDESTGMGNDDYLLTPSTSSV